MAMYCSLKTIGEAPGTGIDQASGCHVTHELFSRLQVQSHFEIPVQELCAGVRVSCQLDTYWTHPGKGGSIEGLLGSEGLWAYLFLLINN